jgi:hypothetical protein
MKIYMCEFTEIYQYFRIVDNIGQKWQILYMKLYICLPCVAVSVSKIGTDDAVRHKLGPKEQPTIET